MEPEWVVRFYNQRSTAEQHIKEGKYAFRWARLSCRKLRDTEVRLQLHALAQSQGQDFGNGAVAVNGNMTTGI